MFIHPYLNLSVPLFICAFIHLCLYPSVPLSIRSLNRPHLNCPFFFHAYLKPSLLCPSIPWTVPNPFLHHSHSSLHPSFSWNHESYPALSFPTFILPFLPPTPHDVQRSTLPLLATAVPYKEPKAVFRPRGFLVFFLEFFSFGVEDQIQFYNFRFKGTA